MFELISSFQAMALEMSMNGLIDDRQFLILESLTENMVNDDYALELTTILTMEDLEDEDVRDCIMAKKFYTALVIMEKEISQIIGKEVKNIDCPF